MIIGSMYETTKSIIESGSYNLSAMIDSILTIQANGRITKAQSDELTALARKHANVTGEQTAFGAIAKLEERIRKVEQQLAAQEDAPGECYPDFEPMRWYHNGDCITWQGKHYKCIVQEPAVCVWSPTDYPTYWEQV